MPVIILLHSLWFVIVKNIVMENIQSKSRKLCQTLKNHKLYSENLDTLKMNEEQLVKAYYAASLPHLKNIKVFIFKIKNLYG